MFRELPENFSSAVDGEPNSVLLRTGRFDPGNSKSYLFRDCREVFVAWTLDEVPGVFAGVEVALRDGNYVAGLLSYECAGHFEPRSALSDSFQGAEDGTPLAWFGIYASPMVFDHDHGAVSPTTQVSPLRASAFGRGDKGGASVEMTSLDGAELEISASEYRNCTARIKRYIEAGDTYQVNFTTRVKMPHRSLASALLSELLRKQPVAYAALINLGETQVVSASPELFFRMKDGRITTQPMKGTAARGKDTVEDAAIAAWLARDEKNRSENVMIVDLLRNDLGRICEAGSVRVDELFSVERFRTLFQMTSTVSGELRPGLSFYEIFKSLFPSGSIVGAPKVRTMQIIRELERRRRGIYTGAIGFISPEREAVFSVAIRTLVLRDGLATMGVGSGIVYDSDADEEYAECRLKAAFLSKSVPEFELIETMLWDGEYFLLELHLERLAASAAYFDFGFERDTVVGRLLELQSGFVAGLRYRVRLLLGSSGGLEVTYVPIEAEPEFLSVMIAAERVASDDLYLRYKTTYRAVYDSVYKAAVEAGFDDALFLNERDELAEGAIHNLLIEKDGSWMTPSLASGLLAGIYRRYLLESRSDLSERVLTLDDLRTADHVWLCNSVRGVREVGKVSLGDESLFSRADSTMGL